MQSRGGVLLRVGLGRVSGSLWFIPVEAVTRISILGAITPVVGLRPPAIGISLADGEVVTVLRIGSLAAREPVSSKKRPAADRSTLGKNVAIVCRVEQYSVAIVGGSIVATGLFALDEAGRMQWADERVAVLDVLALYARAHAAVRSEHSFPAAQVTEGVVE